MVKLTGPFHSDDARGQFGKCMVYIGWRGLKTGRMWKKPANPQTAAQTTQRDLFTSAVDDYHTLQAGDQSGWRLRASGKPYSGFNLFVGDYVDVKISGYTYNTITSISGTTDSTSATIHFSLQYAGTAKVYVGTTPGTWTLNFTNTSATAAKHIVATGLSSGIKYYYLCEALRASTPGESGYHYFTTS